MFPKYLHTKEEVGEITENAVLAALSLNCPHWLLKAERGSVELDMRGIDIVVTLRFRNGTTGVIPIQVKSSEERREEYFRMNPWAKIHGVICLVVKPTDHPFGIRRDALRSIRPKYEAGCCMRQIIDRRLEGAEKLKATPLYQTIAMRRQIHVLNRCQMKAPPPWSRLHSWYLSRR